MREFIYIIHDKYDGIRVDDYLKNVKGYSSRIICKIKKDKSSIMLNGSHIRVVDRMKSGDILYIRLEDTMHIKPNKDLYAKIVYNDSDIIVYDKPANMPVHPSKSHQLDTLANVFANYCEYSREQSIFRPINRLDADTTGLCLVAKNQLSAVNLSGKVFKKYKAVVCGNLSDKHGIIDLPIRRVEDVLIKREVGPGGKDSITEYSLIAKSDEYSLVDIFMRTGRTHQIRVHFSHIGHPLAGDFLYGGDTSSIKRHALHCYTLSFIHPISREPITLSSRIPDDMENLIYSLKNEIKTNKY